MRWPVKYVVPTLLLVYMTGCSASNSGEPEAAGEAPPEATPVAQRAQPQSPRAASGQRSDTDRDAPRTSLIRSIYDALAGADDIGDSARDDARTILRDSDQVLARIKEENREALRQLNRQLRIKRCDAPNIVLIVADDLGYGDLGCYGQTRIQTPNIDRMAAEGIRFTDFYAGDAIGAPSRCALMTGLDSGHGLIRGERVIPLRPEDATVAEVLWAAGYTTGLYGKWGLGDAGTTGTPNQQGFQHFFGYLTREEAENYYPEYMWRNESRVTIEGNRDGQQLVYSQDLITDEALTFIERARQQPFFLVVCYSFPHVRLEVPSDEPYSDEDWPQWAKNYAAMITRMDRDVGEILDRIDELHLDRHTIVFFTSDNGPHAEGGADPTFFDSAGPLRGMKWDLYEGGIRVPMIVRWRDRIRAGLVSDEPWAFWDFLPTAADLANAWRRPHHIDGISMVSALYGGRVPEHKGLYWELHGGPARYQQAYRSGPWKLVRPAPGRPVELYNLIEDIGEENNRAAAEREVTQRLEREMAGARTDSPDWPVPQN